MVPGDAYDELKSYASRLPSIQLSSHSVNDLELISMGAFSPLDKFMGQEDYNHVLHDMCLTNGLPFPIPVTLPVSSEADLHLDADIAIRDSNFELLGVMTIEEIYKQHQSEFNDQNLVFQPTANHPADEVLNRDSSNISGKIQVLQLPKRYEFPDLWLSPHQIRERISRSDRSRVIAFQPIEPELPNLADVNPEGIEDSDVVFLLQLAVKSNALKDLDFIVRTQIYQESLKRFSLSEKIILSLLPYSMRVSGYRETLFQTIIQKNYGATQVLINQSNVSLGGNEAGNLNKKMYELDQRLSEIGMKLGMEIIPTIIPSNGSKRSAQVFAVSQEADDSLKTDPEPNSEELNSSWSRLEQEIIQKMEETQIPQNQHGICIWFTGLSGSGKSTTAEILSWLILKNKRKVKILDGDVVRTHLSRGLGFSKNDRDINVRRIGFVASMLVDLGGVVICAVVSPYRETRQEVRDMIGNDKFVEVFVDTPLAICEERDVKGMYAKARSGELRGFTGIDDPYEPPLQPEIILDTVNHTPEQNAHLIKDYLIEQGIIHSEGRKK